jgi:hypothetical protein
LDPTVGLYKPLNDLLRGGIRLKPSPWAHLASLLLKSRISRPNCCRRSPIFSLKSRFFCQLLHLKQGCILFFWKPLLSRRGCAGCSRRMREVADKGVHQDASEWQRGKIHRNLACTASIRGKSRVNTIQCWKNDEEKLPKDS